MKIKRFTYAFRNVYNWILSQASSVPYMHPQPPSPRLAFISLSMPSISSRLNSRSLPSCLKHIIFRERNTYTDHPILFHLIILTFVKHSRLHKTSHYVISPFPRYASFHLNTLLCSHTRNMFFLQRATSQNAHIQTGKIIFVYSNTSFIITCEDKILTVISRI